MLLGIEILAQAKLRFLGCLQKSLLHRVLGAQFVDCQWSALAVIFAAEIGVVFGSLEVRQHVRERPAGIATRRPGVVVGGRTAQRHRSIGRRAAAGYTCPPESDAPACRVRLAEDTPVVEGVVADLEGVEDVGGSGLARPVVGAGLEEQDLPDGARSHLDEVLAEGPKKKAGPSLDDVIAREPKKKQTLDDLLSGDS